MTALRLDLRHIRVDGRFDPISADPDLFETSIATDALQGGMTRVRVGVRARAAARLEGVKFSGSVTGLGPRVVALAHRNTDQESHGVPSHRLVMGDTVVRGFDQAFSDARASLVISCEHPARWMTEIEATRRTGRLELIVRQTDPPYHGEVAPMLVAADETVWSDPLLVSEWDDPLIGLEAHAVAMGEASDRLEPPYTPALAGWNSWDHYGWMLNETIVRTESAALPSGFRLVGLSGPWFDTFGDWRPHSGRFPSGLDRLIDDLHRDGLLVQLWLAPFLVESDSALIRDHPDWLLSDSDGRPVSAAMAPPSGGAWQYSERTCGVLDATRPDVCQYLTELARRLTTDLGADSLFVDFLRSSTLPGERSDPHSTGVEAMRAGLGALRGGLRPGTMMMGASGVVGLYPGLVHAGRIGPDITLPPLGHPVFSRWTPPGVDPEDGFKAASFPPAAGRAIASWRGVGGVSNEVAALASRWHWHGHALQANPDCVLLLGTAQQARTIATIWSLSGGMFLLGDSMVSLPQPLRELAAHPILTEIRSWHRAARPADLFTHPDRLPAVWALADTPIGDIAAIVCWDDYPVRRTVPTRRRHAENLWTREPIRVVNGEITARVAPHETLLLRMWD